MTMKVAIIGAGVSGLAAVKYWTAKGADVTVHDRRTDAVVGGGVKMVLGKDYLSALGRYDLIVRSPGVKPRDLKTKVPVTSGVREFFAHCPARIIAVTGTKGKEMVAGLTARMLEEAGRRVWLGGDNGASPLDFLSRVKASDLVVLELSSFHLMDLDISPYIAVCLKVMPDDAEMAWHGNMREYIAAKGNLFWHQQEGDVAVFNSQDDFSTQVAQLSPGRKLPYFVAPGGRLADGSLKVGDVKICKMSDAGLTGPDAVETICASATVAWEVLGSKPEPIHRAVIGFKLPDEGKE